LGARQSWRAFSLPKRNGPSVRIKSRADDSKPFADSALAAESAKPTDPQIAHIAYTAGVIDIAAAKQAISKAIHKEVKAFAEDMVRDHEAVNKQALDLVKKLRVTPEDSDTSKSLSKQAPDKLTELSKLKGADYDKAYIASEVAYHKAVNDALETQLIPSASNPELKSLLQA
jgi:putative membrane protein